MTFLLTRVFFLALLSDGFRSSKRSNAWEKLLASRHLPSSKLVRPPKPPILSCWTN
jgi:hypothetical protein